jgi:hypothetical protein
MLVYIKKKSVTIRVNSVVVLDQALARLEISLYHFLNERVEIDVTFPAECLLSFGRPSQELSVSDHVELNAESGDMLTLTRLQQDGSTWDRLEPGFGRIESLFRPHRRPLQTIYKTAISKIAPLKQSGEQLTVFPRQGRGRPSRRTPARSAFHQLRGRNPQGYLAGACATCPLRSHELRGRQTNGFRYDVVPSQMARKGSPWPQSRCASRLPR